MRLGRRGCVRRALPAGTVTEAMLYAFDLRDSRARTRAQCRWSTTRIGWRGCWAGAGSDHIDDDDATIFRLPHGPEGIVSKRVSTLRSGPSRDWLKSR